MEAQRVEMQSASEVALLEVRGSPVVPSLGFRV